MEKQRWEESQKTTCQKRQSKKKENAGARKGRKAAKRFDFTMICGSEESKSRLAKAAGAEPSGHVRDQKLHAVVVRSRFRSQMANARHARSTFGSCALEKVHAGVRSRFSKMILRDRCSTSYDLASLAWQARYIL